MRVGGRNEGLSVIVIGAIAVLLLGLSLLVMGVRGRRINDHPVCRGCRFDLVGIYPAAQTCPECGRGLRPAMVRTGVRRRRRRVAVLGGLMTVAGVIASAGLGVMALSGPGHVKYAPAWWLAVEARTLPKQASDEALTELILRMGKGKVSSGLTKSLVQQGLAEQGDRKRRWNVLWGDLIEAAQSRGLTTRDHDASFLRHAVLPSLWVQPRIHSGDVPRVRLSFAGSPTEYARVGQYTELQLASRLTAAKLDGRSIFIEEKTAGPVRGMFAPLVHRFTFESGSMSEGFYKTATMAELAPIKAEPGRHTLTLTWGVMALSDVSAGTVAASWPVEQTATIDVRSADEPLADLITDDATAAVVQEAFTASATTSSAKLHVVLRWKDLSVPMQYQVVARAEGIEDVGVLSSRRQYMDIRRSDEDGSDDIPDWSSGQWQNEAHYRFSRAEDGSGGVGRSMVSVSSPSELWPQRVDIVLVPDPEEAAKEGILKIWGREIVLRGIEVRRR